MDHCRFVLANSLGTTLYRILVHKGGHSSSRAPHAPQTSAQRNTRELWQRGRETEGHRERELHGHETLIITLYLVYLTETFCFFFFLLETAQHLFWQISRCILALQFTVKKKKKKKKKPNNVFTLCEQPAQLWPRENSARLQLKCWHLSP